MGVKIDKKGRWHFRKQIRLPDGTKVRIFGTPLINTKVAAEAAERAEIEKWLNPEKAAASAQLARDNAAAKAKPQSGLPTFAEYAPKVIESYRPRGKRAGSHSSDLGRATLINGPLMRFFGRYQLDQIDQALVNRAIKSWSDKADQTINNRLAALSVVLRYASQSKLIPRHDLDLRVETRAIEEAKEEEEEEEVEAVPLRDVDKLLAAARDKSNGFEYWMPVAVLLACDAGLRVGEIRAVQWTDAPDIGAHRTLTVRRSYSIQGDVLGPPKNGKPREIPISSRLAAELKRLPRSAVWIIARTRKKFAGKALRYIPMLNAIKRLYEIAGVKMPRTLRTKRRRPWHGLRHTFGTAIAAVPGISDKQITELMGHCDIRTSHIYINPEAQDVARAKRLAIAEAFG
jgi:integrase